MQLTDWINHIRAVLERKLAGLRGKRHCSHCGAEVSASARTCLMCGTALPMPKRKPPRARVSVRKDQGKRSCPHCGASIPQTAKRCTFCDQPVRNERARPARLRSPLAAHSDGERTDLVPHLPVQPETRRRRLERHCPTCGARIPQDASECPMCGTDLHRAAVDRAVQDTLGSQSNLSASPTERQTSAHRDMLRPPTAATLAYRRGGVRWERIALAAIAIGIIVGGAVWALSKADRTFLARAVTRGASAGDTTPAPTRASRLPTRTVTPIPTATRTPRPTTPPTITPTATVTATPTQTATVTPSPTPIVHIVQSGDTLFSIAEFYGVTVVELSQANGLTSQSYLHPNDELIIPISTTASIPLPIATSAPDEVMHTIQAGETLQDIVQRYGISMEKLLEANNLQSGASLTPGAKLVIPVNGDPTPTPTRGPTATPTPGSPFAAPDLLYPLQNADLKDEPVVLQWTSAGILAEDEWYAISLRYLGHRADGQPSEIVVYTRITSWHVPMQWAPGPEASERRFEWTVQLVRRANLSQPPAPLSASSQVRRFRW